MSSGTVEPQISLFRSQVKLRRFGDETLQILQSLLVSKDVKSSLEVRSSLSEFMRQESLCIIREIGDKSVEHKLSVVEFLVRAFALAGDFESCLALRYEALLLRQQRSPCNKWLRVSYREWMTFAEHSLEYGFHSITRKACESALSCFDANSMKSSHRDEFFENIDVIGKIKRLKDVAVASSASRSVQAQTADYLKKKAAETSPSPCLLDDEEAQLPATTLFRNGVKKRNARMLQDHRRRIDLITSKQEDSNL